MILARDFRPHEYISQHADSMGYSVPSSDYEADVSGNGLSSEGRYSNEHVRPLTGKFSLALGI